MVGHYSGCPVAVNETPWGRMVSALFLGSLGTLSTLWIGTQILGLPLTESLLNVLAANVCGLFALFGALQGEATPALRKAFFGRVLTTWVVFASLFFVPLFVLVPAIRSVGGFLWLVAPLIFSTGFAIIVFGPIQDRIVARRQRKLLSRPRG